MADVRSLASKIKPGAWLFGALAGLSAIGYVIDKGQAAVTRALVLPTAKDGVLLPAGAYLLSWLFLLVSISAIGCAVWLGIHYWLREIRHRGDMAAQARSHEDALSTVAKLREKEASDLTKIREEYKAVCNSVQKVVYQTYNPANPTQAPVPRITFKKIDCEFRIGEQGDTTVVQTYEIQTGDEVARFWIVKTVSDGFAAQLDVLSDIDFKTESMTVGAGLEAVPIDMRGNHRSIALFFLPEMQPQAARAFKVMYAWKGWFGELFGPGRDTNWEWSYQSADPDNIADVTFRFVFDAACGGILCENVQTPMPGEQLIKAEQNGVVWTYSNPTAPVGRLNWILRFRREA